MTTVPILQVRLKLDMSTHNNHYMPPHELALMSEIHGQKVQVINANPGLDQEYDFDDDEIFQQYLRDEYERLVNRYKIDKDTKRPWAEIVFGRFNEGRFETVVARGIKHYARKEELTPQQKAAQTRARKKAEKEDAENAVATA